LPVAYRLTFTLAARAELIDAQNWYEKEVPGLGRHFRAAVDTVVRRISTGPQQFPLVYKSVRRALLRGFPYALLFVVEADSSLTVIACFHGSRDPAKWQRRA
jgi:plasmid stabilization system protein ParE